MLIDFLFLVISHLFKLIKVEYMYVYMSGHLCMKVFLLMRSVIIWYLL